MAFFLVYNEYSNKFSTIFWQYVNNLYYNYVEIKYLSLNTSVYEENEATIYDCAVNYGRFNDYAISKCSGHYC